jgi:predicted  nucleic acid-binding Zn-ribbon protein
MDKDKEKLQNEITQLQEHINYLEEQYRDVEEQHEGQVVAQKKAADRIQKIRFNFETIVYLR